MQHANVAELIDRVRRGDEDAREQLFGLCRIQLKQWATTVFAGQLGPVWDLSDAVQESLAEANRDFAAYRGRNADELFAWLRQILSHTILDRQRHQSRQKRHGGSLQSLDFSHAFGTPLKDLVPDAGSSISHRMIRAEQTETLSHMIDHLPEDQATVVRLRHLQGLSVDEISQQMNRSAPSVAGLLIRAMRRLRELMAHKDT
ncbi:sigma-70 family RNA polymerase sigma factor [Thalassoroseus pseudoceratinae]|uniref:sigma-70 family RNA polymerase sigma factor n=1 Tax=Thalassoroseus pseudoceratinae TaxID=2713176 RepID=UPI0014229552|nr:sigma-70 family RNA polymerase sigma factor [Thalassoroseus pseudoceratinae]